MTRRAGLVALGWAFLGLWLLTGAVGFNYATALAFVGVFVVED